jgi:hypothetical protein
MIYQRGKQYYSKSLQMFVIFLRYDSAGMAMVEDLGGEQYTVQYDDLQKSDWTPGEILRGEG